MHTTVGQRLIWNAR